jgi:hypothetical protein
MPPDPTVAIDIEAFAAELQVSDDVLRSIQKLPSTCAELRLPSTVDCISTQELQAVLASLSIPHKPILDSLRSLRGKDRPDRPTYLKTKMLALLAARFGEQWSVLHEILRQRRNAPSVGRRPKSTPESGIALDLRAIDRFVQPYQSALNDALALVHRSDVLPSRDSLIFLSDAEYQSVRHYYEATHPRLPDFGDDCEGTAIEYLVGALKETTTALESYYNIASAARLYVDRIVKHQAECGPASGDGRMFTVQGDAASSEDPSDPTEM